HAFDPGRRPRASAQGRDHHRRSPARHARGLTSDARSRSMGAFEYTALDNAGRSRKGVIEGDTARQVRSLLREKQLLPVTIEAVVSQEAGRQHRVGFSWRRGVSAADLSLLTRQLSTLVRAGL